MMEFKTIKQVATLIRTGKTPPTKEPQYFDGNINWYGPPDLGNEKFLGDAKRTISFKAIKEKKAIEFPANTLLLGCIGDIGKLGITTNICSSNQQITGILPNEHADVNYLYYWFRHSKQLLVSYANKAVVPILNNGTLEKIQIPLPPLEQQKKIAAILDAADEYRQKTKALIAKYDELTQSLFLDMFGDPVKNEKGWEVKQLHSLVSKLGDGIHGTPVYSEEGEYYFINGNNLQQGKVVIDANTKRVSETEYLKHQKVLGNTTVLVSINGSIGKVAFYNNEPIILGKSACYFNLIAGSINKTYLYHIIDSPFFIKYASSEATGSTIKNVSLKSMRNFPIPIPSITIQNQFAERVQAIEVQKAQAQTSLEKAEELFNSLLQRAFKGELV